jgi:hypothetical protein
VVKIKIRTTELEKVSFGVKWVTGVTCVGYEKNDRILLVFSRFRLSDLFNRSVAFHEVAVQIPTGLRLILTIILFGISSSK